VGGSQEKRQRTLTFVSKKCGQPSKARSTAGGPRARLIKEEIGRRVISVRVCFRPGDVLDGGERGSTGEGENENVL